MCFESVLSPPRKHGHRYLDKIKIQLYEVLRELPNARPGVHYSQITARDVEFEEEEKDPDVRISPGDIDKQVDDEREFYEDEKDNDFDSN